MISGKYAVLIAMIYLGSAKLAFAATTAPVQVRSSAEIENSCKAKSKEIALETYRGCVTDAKTAQIEQIRRQYKVKLLALKSYYEGELKKMNKAEAATASASGLTAPAATPVAAQAAAPAAASAAVAAPVQENTAVDESAPDNPEPIPVQSK